MPAVAGPVEDAKERHQFNREKELQREIYQWLIFHEYYFEWDAMHRRTSGRRGRADFRICVAGRWLSLECKVGDGTLTREQASEAARLRKSGGLFAVVRTRDEAIDEVAKACAL